MNRTLILLSMGALIAGSTAHAGEASSAVETYLNKAQKDVEVQKVMVRVNRKNEGSTTFLKSEYKAAAQELAGNEDAKKALKSHWIKLHQCLSATLELAAIKKCGYELSGIAAEVRIDIE